ncbi:mechanosensitive ion channel family protein [Virgibacillus sp. NKC19-16]|uniref:mechanosensitive ion channel family protein n=1 Tax=Virgibacillus salidurans TaxID=2831673 RepID=UPI001F4739D4|nr:mechanosensitive ion channel family protein [Virgibacillus sp. NKC19-16]UJL45660.1 mechanosensitive ion channel family protein [Virgibacillus sp. NKC19-16]
MNFISDFDWGIVLRDAGVIILQLILIWIAYGILKKVGKRIVTRAFDKMQQNGKMTEGRGQVLERLMLSVLSYTLIFIVIVVIFGIFGLPIGGLIAGAGVVGLAIGFGAQGLVSDIVTGFFLLAEKWADVGDYIITAGVDGVVEEIGLRTTQIRDYDGILHFIPNRNIENLSNYSRGDMRALVELGFSYDHNIDEAFRVARGVCDQMAEDADIVEGPNVDGVEAIDNHEIVLRVTAQTENMMQWGVQRKLWKALKEAFDENGISMPYEHQVNVVQKEG